MRDPRHSRLASLLVSHCVAVAPGDKVLIEAFDIPVEFTTEVIDAVAHTGGHPIATTYHQRVLRALYLCATPEQMQAIGSVERARMEAVQCYIGLRGSHNMTEFSDVPAERMSLYEKHWWHPVHSEVRVPRTRWVVLRWPHPSMAQAAGMSTEGFEDFYFRVCVEVDYARMARAMEPLVSLMNGTDRVHIEGPGTDLSFSIAGIPAVACAGQANIPDGEVFTSPIRDSVNGKITFNADTLRRGIVFSGVALTFRNGRITDAEAGPNTKLLNDVLDTDDGARYIGEWALGVNPHILRPMMDTLFDEKIAGSFHLTPGRAYEEADNGNRSQVHWDMVMLQSSDSGGGRIQFDGVTVREDGVFVLPELTDLNPAQLAP